MKISTFLFLSLCISFISFSQNNTKTFPVSFSIENITNDIDVVVLEYPDVEKLILEDEQNIKNGTFDRVGVTLACDYNFNNAGTWEYFTDGSRLWRLQIVAENAIGLGVDMDNFYLPQNTKLFIYNEDRTSILGEFDYYDNIENRFFSSDLVKGQSIIVEYFEEPNVNEEASFNIVDVSYIYKLIPGFSALKDFGDSDPCEVNINCPEGDNWQNEKNGVARILTKVGTSLGWCTGSLINNERIDCTPYFLTADHCGEGASASDMSAWKFYFSWDADSCFSTAQPSYDYTWGCTYYASGGNGGSTGSDFYLVKLNRPVYNPPWNVYLNGWDRSTSPESGGGVCIHHPAGDIMKISTYTSNPVSSPWNFNGLLSHWRVYWSLTVTDKGVTEGGSSGSPLFNSSHRIIGDLTGGGSYCTASNNPDYYGKFSYSWESNGTTSDKQLKPWLDPDNTGITTLDGISWSDCNALLNVEKPEDNIDFNIYPNPTSDYVKISLNDVSGTIFISVVNMMGEIVKQDLVETDNKEVIKFDFNDLTKGVYLINIVVNDKKYNEKVIFIK